MNAAELRRQYLGFFVERGHKLLPSSSLVPNDPTLLFTAAGMVQFKDIFWGRIAPAYPSATTVQKCFRTTDIENVGKTAYHHTFFEMLGNFSFGDYFKDGAIQLAWEFLTKEIGVPGERLTAAVYEEDQEAYDVWHDVVGLPAERIVRLGKEHNWWGPVGNTGPCGPDSEIHFDAGEEHACGPDCLGAACDCDRFNEIWNLVFMQYDAQEDGRFIPLERKNIDTGMGLERTTAVLQGAKTNYDIDVFRAILDAVEAAAPRPLTDADTEYRNTIADHIRGVLFLVADGVMPGNEKQGYVSRRILRRAIRAGGKLELPVGSLATLVDPVIETLGGVYPEIVTAREMAVRLINREEETFRKTLREGERRLDKLIHELTSAGDRVLQGELAFELTDTYGFPLEMTREIAADAGIEIDQRGFDAALEAQRERSRAGISASASVTAEADVIAAGKAPTEFLGYETLVAESEAENVLRKDGKIERLVFPETPFYAESGGQVGDNGAIENLARTGRARVVDVSRNAAGVFLHHVEILDGTFEPGDRCRLTVDKQRRRKVERNHTATHLLHAGLRNILGEHAAQAGSVVNEQGLRFDFAHYEKLSGEQIAEIEDIANHAILADHPVTVEEKTLEDAKAGGAIGLFEDEYRGRNLVRVVRVDGASQELCGGTHVRRSGEIGLVKIVSEESVAAGVRRIRAITGDAVLDRLRETDGIVARLRALLGDDPETAAERLKQETADLRKKLESAEADQARSIGDSLFEEAETISGIRVIRGQADLTADQLKVLGDSLEAKAHPAVIVLGAESGGRAIVLCKRSDEAGAVHAGNVVRAMAQALGGGGGGAPTFAQGGGPNGADLEAALAVGAELVRKALEA